jgi:hypothetical protein
VNKLGVVSHRTPDCRETFARLELEMSVHSEKPPLHNAVEMAIAACVGTVGALRTAGTHAAAPVRSAYSNAIGLIGSGFARATEAWRRRGDYPETVTADQFLYLQELADERERARERKLEELSRRT